MGVGAQVFVGQTSQEAKREFGPYFDESPVYRWGAPLEDVAARTPLLVGSPQQIIDRTLELRDYFGDYQRQMFLIDHGGIPEKTVLDQLDILGEEVLPVLRAETKRSAAEGTPPAPTHASLVEKKYGDRPARAPKPNPNRGDNVTGTSPYQDSDPSTPANLPFG